MYDFLNNFHKRMEKLSYSFLIDNKVSTLNSYKDYFNSLQLINLVYSLMCFVLDRSLKDEECTLNNMSSLVSELAERYYQRPLEEQEAQEITRLMVYKILRNDGKPFVFETIDYNTGQKVVFDFHLLQQKTSKVDHNKSTFMLTQEGYRLLLGALEIDEKTQIDINQMILELSLKKKNFSQGLYAVENLNNLITAQINVINNFIYRTRENIFAIEQRSFEENFLKNIQVLKEQNKKFDELKEIILVEEDRLSQAEGEITKENYQSLTQLGRIKELLTNISYKAGELINRHFHFKEEYKKALEEASSYYNNRRINLKEDLVKQVEQDSASLENLYKLFNPLFKVNLPKSFNINYIFNEQRVYSKEEDEEGVVIEEEEDYDPELLIRQKSREEYRNIVVSILTFMVEKRDIDLRSLVEHYQAKEEEAYFRLVPSVRKFSEVLIEFLRIGTIDLEEIIREQAQVYENEEIEFDLRKILVEEVKEKYRFLSLKSMSFIKAEDADRISVQEKRTTGLEEEFITLETLRCPNILMKLE